MKVIIVEDLEACTFWMQCFIGEKISSEKRGGDSLVRNKQWPGTGKKRENKIRITDIAIKKVQYIETDLEGYDQEELQKSMKKNQELVERMRNDKRYKELVSEAWFVQYINKRPDA